MHTYIIYIYIFLYGDELISEARSLFRGGVGDVVLNCPNEFESTEATARVLHPASFRLTSPDLQGIPRLLAKACSICSVELGRKSFTHTVICQKLHFLKRHWGCH